MMATRKPRRFNEGDLVSDKEAGLKASKGEKVGFFERLRMGNIDQEGSEAYKRFGAGRGKMERTPVEDAVAVPVERKSAKAPDPEITSDQYLGTVDSGSTKLKPGGKPSVGTRAVKSTEPAKSSPKMQEQTYRRTSGDSGEREQDKPYTRKGGATAEEKASYVPQSNYSNEGRGRQMTKEQQYARAQTEAQSPEGKAKRKQQEEAQGLERVYPEEMLIGGPGLKGLHTLAKKMATPKMATYTQPALSAPTPRLPYDKAGAVGRARDARAAARQEEMLAENAARYGLDPKAPGYEAAAGAIRKELGGKDFSFKRGGAVKKSAKPIKKMASGGSTSGASKRGDGIAQRGHTRGKIY
jgi:hypothetical protein